MVAHGSQGPYQARSAEPYVVYTYLGGGGILTMFKFSALSKAHPECPPLGDQFHKKWVKSQRHKDASVVRIFKIEVRSMHANIYMYALVLRSVGRISCLRHVCLFFTLVLMLRLLCRCFANPRGVQCVRISTTKIRCRRSSAISTRITSGP